MTRQAGKMPAIPVKPAGSLLHSGAGILPALSGISWEAGKMPALLGSGDGFQPALKPAGCRFYFKVEGTHDKRNC
jgi:hypothetical protein